MRKNLRVVGLIGLAKSGKTTTLKALGDRYGGVNEIMLAGTLKDACAKAFGVPREHFDDQNFKEKKFKKSEATSFKDLLVVLLLGILLAIELLSKTTRALESSGGINSDLAIGVVAVVLYGFALSITLLDLYLVGTAKTLTEERLVTILKVFDIYSEANMAKVRPHIGVTLTTPRQIAQYIGTDVLRNMIDPDIHIKTAIRNMLPDMLNVVSDIRFLNELDYFRKNIENFVSIFIFRPSVVPENLAQMHASESGVLRLGEQCDLKVVNDMPQQDFEKLISGIVADQVDQRLHGSLAA